MYLTLPDAIRANNRKIHAKRSSVGDEEDLNALASVEVEVRGLVTQMNAELLRRLDFDTGAHSTEEEQRLALPAEARQLVDYVSILDTFYT